MQNGTKDEKRKFRILKPAARKNVPAMPERLRIDLPFVRKTVDWQPVRLSLRDHAKLARAWARARYASFRNWKYEHVFLVGASVGLSFALAYVVWMVVMSLTVRKAFYEDPAENYSGFSVFEAYTR